TEGGINLGRIELGPVEFEAEAVGFDRQQLNGRGFIDDGYEPVLQRARLESDPAVRIRCEVLAAFAGRFAERPSLSQPGVQLADVLRSGDNEDAVSHAKHGRDAVVNDGLGERANRANFVVDTGEGILVRRAGRFMHGGLAGVQHEYRNASVVEKLAKFAAG